MADLAEGKSMTLKNAYTEAREMLETGGIMDAPLDAWLLLEYVTGVSRASYYADPDREISEADLDRYSALIRKRAGHIPLQHLTGTQEFMGLEFAVNEHVLIPRQDTEVLAEEALDALKKGDAPTAEDGRIRILDMCTGSGCILLSVLHWGRKLLRSRAPQEKGPGGESDVQKSLWRDILIEGTGADLSADALDVAEENARRLGMEAEFVQSDLFENISGRYGMILSNPPYIRTSEIEKLQEEVRLYDPVLALDGREDGLYFYRRIVRESRGCLEKGGLLMFEIGFDQAEEVSGLMRDAGFTGIRVKKDLAGLDRVVSGVLK